MLQHVDSKLHPQIRVRASAIFWSIWLTRNDVIFDKNTSLSFIGYFQDNLLDAVLVNASKGNQPIKFDEGIQNDGDYSNGDFC